MGPLWEGGVSRALGNPQHGGIGWIQPPRTHQLLVAPYKVVCGHPDGSHCSGQGSTHCRSLWSQPSGFISTACEGGDGKSLPLLVLLRDGVSACVCLCVLKSPSCRAMHGKRQATQRGSPPAADKALPALSALCRPLDGPCRRVERELSLEGQGFVLQCPLCPEWQHMVELCSSSLGRAVSQQGAALRLACGLDAGDRKRVVCPTQQSSCVH